MFSKKYKCTCSKKANGSFYESSSKKTDDQFYEEDVETPVDCQGEDYSKGELRKHHALYFETGDTVIQACSRILR
jgi:hypothetical protein